MRSGHGTVRRRGRPWKRGAHRTPAPSWQASVDNGRSTAVVPAMTPSFNMLLRRRRAAPGDSDSDAIIHSPLNEPAIVSALLGEDASADAWQRRYFALAADARPALTPFFDPAFYREANPDVAGAGVDPYLHFLAHGLAEGRSPHPLIDVAFMRQQLARQGGDGLIDANRLVGLLRDNTISPHPMFDVRYYLHRYPDVADSGTSAVLHFITHGAEEGRSPHSGFDPDAELQQCDGGSRYRAYLRYAGAAAVPVPAGAGGVQGVFDGVGDHAAQGWAFDPTRPGVRLEIEIVEGDRVVARGHADRLREDLRRAGIGDGRCHFRLALSSELRDGAPHVLVARVAATGAVLQGSHRFVSRARPGKPYDAVPLSDTLQLARKLVPNGAAFTPPERYLDALARCNLLIETGQGAEAVSALEDLSARYPGHPVTDLKVGEAQLEAGDPAAAIVALGRVDPRGPLAGWSLLGMGNASRLMEHWAEAEAFYVQAQAIAPQLPHARRRLRQLGFREARAEAVRLAEAGDRRAAIAQLVPELISNPGDPGVCDMVAGLLDETGDADRAGGYDDPLINRANSAWRLLGVVAASGHERRERGH